MGECDQEEEPENFQTALLHSAKSVESPPLISNEASAEQSHTLANMILEAQNNAQETTDTVDEMMEEEPETKESEETESKRSRSRVRGASLTNDSQQFVSANSGTSTVSKAAKSSAIARCMLSQGGFSLADEAASAALE